MFIKIDLYILFLKDVTETYLIISLSDELIYTWFII